MTATEDNLAKYFETQSQKESEGKTKQNKTVQVSVHIKKDVSVDKNNEIPSKTAIHVLKEHKNRLFTIWTLIIIVIMIFIAVSSALIHHFSQQITECTYCQYKYSSCIITGMFNDGRIVKKKYHIQFMCGVNNTFWNHSTQLITETPTDYHWGNHSITTIQTVLIRYDTSIQATTDNYRIWDHHLMFLESDNSFGKNWGSIFWIVVFCTVLTLNVVFCGYILYVCCNDEQSHVHGKIDSICSGAYSILTTAAMSGLVFLCWGCCIGGIAVVIIGSIINIGLNDPPNDAIFSDIYYEYNCSVRGINDIKYYIGKVGTYNADNDGQNVYFGVIEYLLLDTNNHKIGVSVIEDLREYYFDSLFEAGYEYSEIYSNGNASNVLRNYLKALLFDTNQDLLCIENRDTKQVIIVTEPEDKPKIDWLNTEVFTDHYVTEIIVLGAFCICCVVCRVCTAASRSGGGKKRC